MKTSIGWVARRKTAPHDFAGFKARCKVYASRKVALNGARGWVGGTSPYCRFETDEEVLAKWDVVEVFAEFPG